MKKSDLKLLVNSSRENGIDVYIHKKCSDSDLKRIFLCFSYYKLNAYNDNDAHVIKCTDTCVAYRVGNEIYIVPATIKAVVNNGDNKIHLWFDYPIDMDRKDLVKY